MESINPSLLWLVVGLVFFVAELIVPGVILVFFAFGAWFVSLCIFLGFVSSTSAQIILFSISSVLFLLLLRKFIRTQFSGHMGKVQDPEINLDDFKGQKIRVLQTISAGTPGKVEYKGASWTARSSETLNKGSWAEIERADGIVLEVKKPIS